MIVPSPPFPYILVRGTWPPPLHPRRMHNASSRPVSIAVPAVNEFEYNLQASIDNAMCRERMDIAPPDK